MRRTFTYKIKAKNAGQTIEHFLRENGYSRHLIIHLKKTMDGIICDGIRAYARYVLQIGNELTINIHEDHSSKNIVPVKMPLDIIYEDADIMVLNKPANMPIHPSQDNYDNTLANGVAYYFASQNTPYTYRCINRLDRDTTGLLVLAKHMLSASILSQMMKDRQINRSYLALVSGVIDKDGTINAPIGRLEGSTIERFIDKKNGETAITHYKSLKIITLQDTSVNINETNTPAKISLIEVHLETGRTHQIRVHMSSIGHPLIGDTLYSHIPTQLLNRQALHSHRLTFAHPITKKAMDFVSPPPFDMSSIIS